MSFLVGLYSFPLDSEFKFFEQMQQMLKGAGGHQ